MEKYLIYILAGFIGGIIRGLGRSFQTFVFVITILIFGIVGGAAGAENLYNIKFLGNSP